MAGELLFHRQKLFVETWRCLESGGLVSRAVGGAAPPGHCSQRDSTGHTKFACISLLLCRQSLWAEKT